jgi:hypothetical protein
MLAGCFGVVLLGTIVRLRRLEAAVAFLLRGRSRGHAKLIEWLLVDLRFSFLRRCLSLIVGCVFDVVVAKDSKLACVTRFDLF